MKYLILMLFVFGCAATPPTQEPIHDDYCASRWHQYRIQRTYCVDRGWCFQNLEGYFECPCWAANRYWVACEKWIKTYGEDSDKTRPLPGERIDEE